MSLRRIVQIVQMGVVAASLFVPGVAWAQSAGIAGVVRDTTGGVMPGVTVEAASPALIEKVRTVVSDGEGRYNIVDLRPGLYTVTFTLEGFNTFKREGIELTTAFTAAVNAEMRVGSLAETVTVTGASPIVDVQNVRSQTVLSRAVIDALPTGRTIQSYAALTPGVSTNTVTMQDVGGNKGDQYGAVVAHGSRTNDSTITFDGMRFNNAFNLGGGISRFWVPNNVAVTEVSIETSGMSAEVNTGGVYQNSVPKDGANTFSVYFSGSGTNDNLQGSNLTDRLRARGMQTISKSKKIWDFGGGLGGPIMRDKLWFYTAHRYWGSQEYAADVFYNKNHGIYVGGPNSGVSLYEPDRSRQGFTHYPFKDHSLRLTLQAASKHKFTAFYSNQRNCMCQYRLEVGSSSPEGNASHWFTPNYLASGTWTYTATNRVLFQAGGALLYNRLNSRGLEGHVTPDDISIVDLGRNFRYNSPAGSISATGIPYGKGSDVSQHNERFSMSYVTGSHSFKAGLFAIRGKAEILGIQGVNRDVNYQFINGVPLRILQWATPANSRQSVQEIAFYAQDQWSVGRVTLNVGTRFDRITGLIPEQDRPAGRFVPAFHIDRRENVPNFTDLSPRVGVAYDLFGNGKTAVKASVGRYLGQFGIQITQALNPANALTRNALRTWGDADKDFIPDCDLTSFAANGECGALTDRKFGTAQTNLRFADDALNGFGNREYNWQTSASIQHELRPGMGVTVGYFRTWFGNFVTVDNTLLGPEDYDPYCITAPVDSRLPGGGGYQLCDVGDVKPAKFGLTDYLVTRTSHYGKERSEVFNGVDVNFNSRFGQGGFLQGGVSWGRTATQCVGANVPYNGATPELDVHAPFQFCTNVPPFRPEFKASAIYPLPIWGLQTSVTFQQLPGAPFGSASSGEGETNVNYLLTNANQAASGSTLGRKLNAGAALVTLVEPNQIFEDRLTQLDVRLSKSIQVGRTRLQGMFDIYNITNSDTVLSQQVRYTNVSPIFRQPRSILGARMFKFGAQLNF